MIVWTNTINWVKNNKLPSVLIGINLVMCLIACILLLQLDPIVRDYSTELPAKASKASKATKVEPKVSEKVLREKLPILYCLELVSGNPYDKSLALFVQNETYNSDCNYTYIQYSFSPYDIADVSGIKEQGVLKKVSCSEAEAIALRNKDQFKLNNKWEEK